MEGTFCFVDLAGFTALTEAHGAETAADLVANFTALVRNALQQDDGRLIDRIGDAVFVVCAGPEEGVRFVGRLFVAAGEQADFPALRAGLHHGEALKRDGAFYGATVNLAARVAAQAHGDQVLATGQVAAAARKQGLQVDSLGMVQLKNVREPVELFALHVLGGTAHEAIDPVCRMRVDREMAAGHLRHKDIDYWFCSLACVREFADDPSSFIRGTLND